MNFILQHGGHQNNMITYIWIDSINNGTIAQNYDNEIKNVSTTTAALFDNHVAKNTNSINTYKCVKIHKVINQLYKSTKGPTMHDHYFPR